MIVAQLLEALNHAVPSAPVRFTADGVDEIDVTAVHVTIEPDAADEDRVRVVFA